MEKMTGHVYKYWDYDLWLAYNNILPKLQEL